MVLDLTSIPQSVQVLFLHEGAERVGCWTGQALASQACCLGKKISGELWCSHILKNRSTAGSFLKDGLYTDAFYRSV